MPHALLLSPDDQAVSAITGVLEEMSVTCERPLDGTSAAQKLNSQSFDLVLVDCENLPAAKLIFDVCRRGKNGNNPVPIAIVDGRAGLPTAFRLGAELILTKPVAKDQARTTIRTAVSRVRKDIPANENVPVHSASAAAGAVVSEAHAQGAAAGGSSSQLTSFAEPAPSFAASSTAAASSSAASAAAPAMKMNSAVEEIARSAAPKAASILNPRSASSSTSSLEPSLSEASSAAAVSVKSKLVPPTIPSDDPVLAELERTEQEASDLLEIKDTQIKNPEQKAKPAQPEHQSFAPVFSYQQNRQKPRGTLVALFVLMLACAGFYAAWTYQPGFREIAQPQIDRVLMLVDRGLVLAGIEHPQQNLAPASNAPKPSAQPAPATTPATVSESPTDPNQTPSTSPDSAASSPTASATNSPTTSAVANAANVPTQPTGTPGKATAAPTSTATTTTAPVAPKSTDSKLNDSKLSDNKNDKKDALAAALSSAPLPGENNAIILSSKGAEKRLSHSVPPKYPAEARSGAEGTIVLKEVVDETGKVDGVRLVEGDATLAASAIKAVKQWRYRPYVRDGKVQAFQTVVIIDFQHP